MDKESKIILNEIGLEFSELHELDGLIIPREELLSDFTYNKIKNLLHNLKKIYSSSFMTCLQKNADISQKWPLLNLVRQLLSLYNYKMEPIRKSDGYTLEGVKKYKRFFKIKKKQNNTTKNIIINLSHDEVFNSSDEICYN